MGGRRARRSRARSRPLPGREEGGASPPPNAAPAHVRSRAPSIPGPRPRPRPPRPRPIAGGGTAAPTPAARPALPPATSRPPALLGGAPDHRTRLRGGSLTPSPSCKLCRRALSNTHTGPGHFPASKPAAAPMTSRRKPRLWPRRPGPRAPPRPVPSAHTLRAVAKLSRVASHGRAEPGSPAGIPKPACPRPPPSLSPRALPAPRVFST